MTPEDADTRIRARALKFVKNGSRLIASYLNHGVVQVPQIFDLGSHI